MQGITIKEHGLMFVWACLKEYVGSSWPILAIFLCGIVAGILLALFGKKKEAPAQPLHFVTEDGYHIYVGKNNIQNDYLSFVFACNKSISAR